jgi:HemY protein
MIRLLLFFILVTLIAAAGAWLADRPGAIVIDWQGYLVETSVAMAAVALAVFAALVVLLWSLLRFLFESPHLLGRFMDKRRRERGLKALSRGMIAVGAGDGPGARRWADEARHLVPHEPLTHLLSAQAAQLGGTHEAAIGEFRAMLDAPETRLLALHGLFHEARRQGQREAARHYAEEALKAAPRLPWAGRALFELQCADGDWEGALRTLQVNVDNKLLDKAEARRSRAVLLTARAQELEDSAPERAFALASEAHGLDVSLVPAAATAGRLASRLGHFGRASRMLEKTWRVNAHPEIADIYAHVRPGDAVRDRLKRVRALADKAPNKPESRMALAEAAIDAHEWPMAREALEPLLSSHPTVRVCRLMAEIEQGETGDRGRAREWLARTLRARPDPVWIADGVISERWLPISPVTGRLDAFEWKVPVQLLVPADETLALDMAEPEPTAFVEPEDEVEDIPPEPAPSPAAVAAGAVDAQPEAEPAEPADQAEPIPAIPLTVTEPVEEASVEEAPRADLDSRKGEETSAEPVAPLPGDRADGESVSEEESRLAPEEDDREPPRTLGEDDVALPRPPDDPGPLPPEEEERPKRRFGLF